MPLTRCAIAGISKCAYKLGHRRVDSLIRHSRARRRWGRGAAGEAEEGNAEVRGRETEIPRMIRG